MQSDSTQAYEITFSNGRKVRCSKIGPALHAAIDTAVQFGERVVVTISPRAGPQMMVVFEGDVAPS
jgi:hypothetical protein